MLHKWIYKLGMERRNPSLAPYLDFLMKSEEWTLSALEDYQFEKCKELCIFASQHSPFYRQRFEEVGFKPEKMQSVYDLSVLPLLGKDDLRVHHDEIAARYSFRTVTLAETSGTSGQPLSFYRNEEWDSHNRAAMFRGYAWYGVNPWDKNGYFWGYNIDKSQRWKTMVLDGLQNRFRLFDYDEQHIRRFVERLKGATFVSGYSSMIYEVAKMINELGISNKFGLRMVKGTSEKIYPSYQEEVMKAFGRKMISEYGSCESGLIAYECPEGGHMHINMENVVVEEVDGEMVVTNLLSHSFPIIRYRLGDSIRLAPRGFRCPCGREHPVLLDVLGRVGKKVVGKQKNYPSLTFYYVFKNLLLTRRIALNYQAVQERAGHILLRIEQNRPELQPYVETELKRYFSDDLEVDIRWGESLHAMDGKLRDFITHIQ